MADDLRNDAAGEGWTEVEPGSPPDLTTPDHAGKVDHPHAGIAEEGWSQPPCDPSATHFAKLILKRGGAESDVEFPLCPPAIVGRFDPEVGPIDVDLGSLPEGVYVSRRHAKIKCEDGVWRIEDLGSSNGTFLLRDDFERVESAELKDGDEVAFGNARFAFRVAPPPA